MEDLKQQLLDDTIKVFKEKEEEIEKSNKELELLDARVKVEKRFFELKDITEEMKEDVKYSLQALESMVIMEKERNAELKKESELLKVRKQVINMFEKEDFRY
jgi:hypothetical protein